jgi:hypothetical protein
MPIPFSCNSCGRSLNVRDELVGKQIYCPDCKTILTVPYYAQEPEPEPEPDVALAAAAPPADDLSTRAEEPPPPAPVNRPQTPEYDEDWDEAPPLRRPAAPENSGPRIGAIIGGLALMGVSGLILIIQIAGGFVAGALLKLMIVLFIAGIVTFIKGLLGKTD